MSFRNQTIQISVYIEIKNSHKFKSTNCVIQGLLQFFHAIGVNTLISNELYLCIIISVVFENHANSDHILMDIKEN